MAFCPIAIPDDGRQDGFCGRGFIVGGNSQEIRHDAGWGVFLHDTGTHVPERKSGGKDVMGLAKADDKNTQPPMNQPGGDIAVRRQLTGGMMKPL